MNWEVVAAQDLSTESLATWKRLQHTEPILANPFFSPEFVQTVDEVKGHVEVAVLKDGLQTVGFLPFERHARKSARPVANCVAEIEGAIIDRTAAWDILECLRAADLKSWNYDCAPQWQASLTQWSFCEREFPYIDLSHGFDFYSQQRKEAGSSQITQAQRKLRKLGREVGPCRLELNSTDDDAFAALLEWKSAQYRRTKTQDMFQLPWVVELLERLRTTTSADFASMFSVLYAGDEIVAVHFGIRSRHVLAWWFPTYNPRFEKYSPGAVFLTQLCEAVPYAGLERIDLGQGEERYKQSFKTGDFLVTEGCVSQRPLQRILRQSWMQVRDWANNSPQVGKPLRAMRRIHRWMQRQKR